MHRKDPEGSPVRHRDGSKGCWRSAASRENDRQRVKRWRKENHDHYLRNNRRHWKTYSAKHPRITPRLARAEAAILYQLGLSIVGPKPHLIYMDTAGRFHREDNLSAEQLIARWKKQHKKKGTKP